MDCRNVFDSASPHLMDLRGLRVTKNAYFSLLTLTKQLLLVTLCDMTAGIENLEVGHDAAAAIWTDRRKG